MKVLENIIYKISNQLRHFKILQFVKQSVSLLKKVFFGKKFAQVTDAQEQKISDVLLMTGNEVMNILKRKMLVQVCSIILASISRISYLWPRFCEDSNKNVVSTVEAIIDEDNWGG